VSGSSITLGPCLIITVIVLEAVVLVVKTGIIWWSEVPSTWLVLYYKFIIGTRVRSFSSVAMFGKSENRD